MIKVCTRSTKDGEALGEDGAVFPLLVFSVGKIEGKLAQEVRVA
jgi:hypothetical protein